MMVAAVLAISFLMLFQFFVSYTRSLIARSRCHELSEQIRGLCGLSAGTMAGDQFMRLAQLLDLCPGPGGDGIQVRAVAVYFRLLSRFRVLSSRALPAAMRGIDEEPEGCACVAAMVLERRIAYSRTLTSQQASR